MYYQIYACFAILTCNKEMNIIMKDTDYEDSDEVKTHRSQDPYKEGWNVKKPTIYKARRKTVTCPINIAPILQK